MPHLFFVSEELVHTTWESKQRDIPGQNFWKWNKISILLNRRHSNFETESHFLFYCHLYAIEREEAFEYSSQNCTRHYYLNIWWTMYYVNVKPGPSCNRSTIPINSLFTSDSYHYFFFLNSCFVIILYIVSINIENYSVTDYSKYSIV